MLSIWNFAFGMIKLAMPDILFSLLLWDLVWSLDFYAPVLYDMKYSISCSVMAWVRGLCCMRGLRVFEGEWMLNGTLENGHMLGRWHPNTRPRGR